MSIVTLEVLKDLRRGGQQFSLQPGVWWHCQDSFLSPFFSVPFSLASSPFSSNIQRNSEKFGRSSGSLAVFPWSGWSFHWPGGRRMFWNRAWSHLWVFFHLSTGLWNAKHQLHVSFLVADSLPNYVLLRLILALVASLGYTQNGSNGGQKNINHLYPTWVIFKLFLLVELFQMNLYSE